MSDDAKRKREQRERDRRAGISHISLKVPNEHIPLVRELSQLLENGRRWDFLKFAVKIGTLKRKKKERG